VYAYFPTGQVSSLTSPDGVQLSFSYFGGLPRSETTTSPDQSSTQLVFAYDSDLRLSEVSLLLENQSQAIAYRYDADGWLIQSGDERLTLDSSSAELKEVALGSVRETLSYDPSYGELVSSVAGFNGQTLFSESLTR